MLELSTSATHIQILLKWRYSSYSSLFWPKGISHFLSLTSLRCLLNILTAKKSNWKGTSRDILTTGWPIHKGIVHITQEKEIRVKATSYQTSMLSRWMNINRMYHPRAFSLRPAKVPSHSLSSTTIDANHRKLISVANHNQQAQVR